MLNWLSPLKPEPTDRTGVETARDWFQLGDDFPCALFGGAGDRTAWETRAQRRDLIDAVTQSTFDRRDEMKHLLEAFELEQFRDATLPNSQTWPRSLRSRSVIITNSAISLGEVTQVVSRDRVGVGLGTARTRALDRTGANGSTGHLRNSSGEAERTARSSVSKKRRTGRRRVMPQRFIKGEGIAGPRRRESGARDSPDRCRQPRCIPGRARRSRQNVLAGHRGWKRGPGVCAPGDSRRCGTRSPISNHRCSRAERSAHFHRARSGSARRIPQSPQQTRTAARGRRASPRRAEPASPATRSSPPPNFLGSSSDGEAARWKHVQDLPLSSAVSKKTSPGR